MNWEIIALDQILNGFYVGPKLSDEEFKKILLPKDYIGAMVNYSFCIEILLKARLTDKKRTHNLKTIFSLIDNNTRKEIVENIGIKQNEFVKMLKNNANCYNEWRYYYEIDEEILKGDFLFLKELATTLIRLSNVLDV